MARNLYLDEHCSQCGSQYLWVSFDNKTQCDNCDYALNPADFNHLFRTFLGLPPSKDDKPLCGADLPDSWDFAGPRPPCPACEALRSAS